MSNPAKSMTTTYDITGLLLQFEVTPISFIDSNLFFASCDHDDDDPVMTVKRMAIMN